MIESARLRVTLPYTLLFAAIVLVSATGIYWLIRNNAYWRLDETLQSTSDVATLSLFHEIQEHRGEGKQSGESALREVLRTMYQNSFPQEQILIRDGGRLIAYKKNLGRPQSDLRKVTLKPGRRHADILDLRIAAKQVYVPEANTAYTIVVSTWRGDVSNDLASVLRALAITISSALLLALLGGYILAKRTLAPLRAMAVTVDAITSNNLDLRVAIVNPNDELGQLARCFNHLLNRLQLAFTQQRQFMADASHELRTPITSALTAAQVTSSGSTRTEEEFREALAIIEEQMLRLRRIVNNMFLLAQADAHALEHHRKTVYLDEIASEACRAVRFVAESKGLRLNLANLRELRCTGDSGLLRQALLILLDNACKYTPAGGSIFVELSATPETCILRISDSGGGIPEWAQERIFERFYRVDKSRSRSGMDHGGAGLGLPIARWIAELHGGTVYLESSTSNGSVFVVKLPRAPESSAGLDADSEALGSSHVLLPGS